jgi:hypothetical protein
MLGISHLSVQDKPQSAMGRFLIAIYVQLLLVLQWWLGYQQAVVTWNYHDLT